MNLGAGENLESRRFLAGHSLVGHSLAGHCLAGPAAPAILLQPPFVAELLQVDVEPGGEVLVQKPAAFGHVVIVDVVA